MRIILLVFFSLIAICVLVARTTTNSQTATVVFEDDRVRVLRLHFEPHQQSEMHTHPALIFISLTPNSRRVYLTNGSYRDLSSKIGDIHWSEPATVSVQNLADTPSESIEIEFKKAVAPAVSVVPNDVFPHSGELSRPVPVQQEPHHHLVFENQYVRVLEVNLLPGEITLFHTHIHDNLAVRVSDSRTQTQMQGEDWKAVAQVEHGSVVFSKGRSEPYTHRIKNAGTDTFHVFDVELLD